MASSAPSNPPLSYADRAKRAQQLKNTPSNTSVPRRPGPPSVSVDTRAPPQLPNGNAGHSAPRADASKAISPPTSADPTPSESAASSHTQTSHTTSHSMTNDKSPRPNGAPASSDPAPPPQQTSKPAVPNVWNARIEQMAQAHAQSRPHPQNATSSASSSLSFAHTSAPGSAGSSSASASASASASRSPREASGPRLQNGVATSSNKHSPESHDESDTARTQRPRPSPPAVDDPESWPEVGKAATATKAPQQGGTAHGNESHAEGRDAEKEKKDEEASPSHPPTPRKSEKPKWVAIPPEELRAAADAQQRSQPHSRSQSTKHTAPRNHGSGSGAPSAQGTSASHSRIQSRASSAHSSPRHPARGRRLHADDAPALPTIATAEHLSTMPPPSQPPPRISPGHSPLPLHAPVPHAAADMYQAPAHTPPPPPPPHAHTPGGTVYFLPPPPASPYHAGFPPPPPAPYGALYPPYAYPGPYMPYGFPPPAPHMYPYPPPLPPQEPQPQPQPQEPAGVPPPTQMTRAPPPQEIDALAGYRALEARPRGVVFGSVGLPGGSKSPSPAPVPADARREDEGVAALNLKGFSIGVQESEGVGEGAEGAKWEFGTTRAGEAEERRAVDVGGLASGPPQQQQQQPVSEPEAGTERRAFDVGGLFTGTPVPPPPGQQPPAAPEQQHPHPRTRDEFLEVKDFGYGFGRASGTGLGPSLARAQRVQRERDDFRPRGRGGGPYVPGPRRGRGFGGRGFGGRGGYARGGFRGAHPHPQYTPPGAYQALPPPPPPPGEAAYYAYPPYEPPPPQPQYAYPPPGEGVYAQPLQPPPGEVPYALDPTRYQLLMQLEYYFSMQNLSRDPFLRQNMDSRGWIPMALLASFPRVRQLTADDALVREVCALSGALEVSASGTHVRLARGAWAQVVFPNAAESTVEEPGAAEEHEHEEEEDCEEDEEDEVEFVMGREAGPPWVAAQ